VEGRLTKSRTDRMVAGVAGGIAEYYGWDATWVRLAFVALAIAWGSGLIAYIVLAVLMPEPEDVTSPAEGSAAAASAPEPGPETPADAASGQAVGPAGDPPPPQQPGPETPPSAGAPPEATPVVAAAPVTAAATPRRRSGGGIVGGIVLVIIGVAVLAGQFIPNVGILSFWPLLIIVPALFGVFRAHDVVGVLDSLTTVFVGCLLLANMLGYLPWSIWLSILSLWPLLIIAIGVSIVGRGLQMTWIRALAQLIIAGGLAYGAFVMTPGVVGFPVYLTWPGGATTSFASSVPHDPAATSGTVEITGGATHAEMSSGSELASIVGSAPTSAQPVLTARVTGGRAAVQLMTQPPGLPVHAFNGNVRMKIDRAVRWDRVAVTTGFSSGVLDLTDLNVGAVSLSGGVSDQRVVLGEKSPTVNVDVSGGVANVTIGVPANARVTVDVTGGLVNVAAPGFDRTSGGFLFGGTYARAGTGGPDIRVNVSGGLSNVTLYVK
jgi:phage shock protein C